MIGIVHGCHWPGCERRVSPRWWGCREHWQALPVALRQRLWATYRPAQEIGRRPSAAYLEAVAEVEQWIEAGALEEARR
jgi:hypothetical protein